MTAKKPPAENKEGPSKRCHWCHVVGPATETGMCRACGRPQPFIRVVDRVNGLGKRILDTEASRLPINLPKAKPKKTVKKIKKSVPKPPEIKPPEIKPPSEPSTIKPQNQEEKVNGSS